LSAIQQCWNFGKEYWRKIGTPVPDGLSHIAPDEECIVPEMSLHSRSHVTRFPNTKKMTDYHILKLPKSFHHCIDKDLRHRAAWMNPDSIP
jgi:hypothetical protein